MSKNYIFPANGRRLTKTDVINNFSNINNDSVVILNLETQGVETKEKISNFFEINNPEEFFIEDQSEITTVSTDGTKYSYDKNVVLSSQKIENPNVGLLKIDTEDKENKTIISLYDITINQLYFKEISFAIGTSTKQIYQDISDNISLSKYGIFKYDSSGYQNKRYVYFPATLYNSNFFELTYDDYIQGKSLVSFEQYCANTLNGIALKLQLYSNNGRNIITSLKCKLENIYFYSGKFEGKELAYAQKYGNYYADLNYYITSDNDYLYYIATPSFPNLTNGILMYHITLYSALLGDKIFNIYLYQGVKPVKFIFRMWDAHWINYTNTSDVYKNSYLIPFSAGLFRSFGGITNKYIEKIYKQSNGNIYYYSNGWPIINSIRYTGNYGFKYVSGSHYYETSFWVDSLNYDDKELCLFMSSFLPSNAKKFQTGTAYTEFCIVYPTESGYTQKSEGYSQPDSKNTEFYGDGYPNWGSNITGWVPRQQWGITDKARGYGDQYVQYEKGKWRWENDNAWNMYQCNMWLYHSQWHSCTKDNVINPIIMQILDHTYTFYLHLNVLHLYAGKDEMNKNKQWVKTGWNYWRQQVINNVLKPSKATQR